MSLNKGSLWLTTLVMLAGCPGPEEKPKLSAVSVTCAPTSLEVGQTSQCEASSQPFAVSSYTWTSSNESVATVDSTGKVTPVDGGTATITASATVDGITKEGQATLTFIKPTVHETAITANETWRAANNPHVLRGAREVTGSATLTIEPGVELRFEQDAELRVTTGALRALGTQEAPIRMVARQSVPTKGYWRGVVLAAAGSDSELNHVTLSHCGNASGKGACLALENQAAPMLRNVTVRDSATAGVLVADDGSAFGTDSTMLSVSGSEGYPVRIAANQASTLPVNGTFTGNTLQAIELRGDVSRTQTWPNPGIPYVVNGFIGVSSSSNPTLTISAGTVLRFGAEAGLGVGSPLAGGLIVDGTATAPVLLTADAASPTPGHWLGVVLRGNATANNFRISHTTIEYGGGIGDIDEGYGNLTVFGANTRPVIDNVVVRKGLYYGISVARDGAGFGPGSNALSAHDNGASAILVAANQAGTIPTGGTFHGNAHDAVRIYNPSGVASTQTWPNLGIPYVINHFMPVGSTSTPPTLTLLEGTELRFGPDGGISVGANGRPGILRAVGTTEVKIRFVPDTTTPTRGFWRGLHFWDANGSLANHIVVTHAGAGGRDLSIGTGNLNVYKDIGTFAVNSLFSDSSGCGVTVSDGTRPGTDNVTRNFVSANQFSNNAGADQCTN